MVKNHSEETKEKISEGMKRYWKEWHHTRALLKEAGFPFSPDNRKHSEETKEKISKTLKNRSPHPNSIAALEKWHKESKELAELKKKLRQLKF